MVKKTIESIKFTEFSLHSQNSEKGNSKKENKKRRSAKDKKKGMKIFSIPILFSSHMDNLLSFSRMSLFLSLVFSIIVFPSYIDSGAAIPRVSREFASTILAQSTRANLAALTFSSSAAITGTKR